MKVVRSVERKLHQSDEPFVESPQVKQGWKEIFMCLVWRK